MPFESIVARLVSRFALDDRLYQKRGHNRSIVLHAVRNYLAEVFQRQEQSLGSNPLNLISSAPSVTDGAACLEYSLADTTLFYTVTDARSVEIDAPRCKGDMHATVRIDGGAVDIPRAGKFLRRLVTDNDDYHFIFAAGDIDISYVRDGMTIERGQQLLKRLNIKPTTVAVLYNNKYKLRKLEDLTPK